MPASDSAPPPRFGRYADRYARYRLTYSPALYDRLEAKLEGPHAHAVDLGAGTGQVALDLLGRFARVTAVEPDPDMAARIPEREGLSVVRARAEDAAFPDASVDAVTAGTAFHWMDADIVCARAARWLRPGGVFFAFAYELFTAVETPRLQALFDAESALWQSHKHAKLVSFEHYPDRMRATGAFARVEPVRVEHDWRASVERIAGFLLTTSFATAYAQATGDAEGYAADFTRRTAEAAGGPTARVRYPVEGGMGWA